MSGALRGAVVGAIFALGLAIAGMTKPSVVLAFLTLGPHWNPALAFVMAGAIGVHVVALRLAGRRSGPLVGGTWPTAARPAINGRLLGGAALFGVGWGLSGVCPGPAITVLPTAGIGGVVFFAGMLAGLGVAGLLPARGAARASPEADAGVVGVATERT